MSLYDDASLILYPSGYKEDKIYSLKPTDGSGDLTFTRASTATRVNSDGLIETSPVNLLQQSETFENATWTKDGLTVTTNTTVAPNGTTTADTFTEGSASGQHRIYQVSAQSTNIYTISVYVKNITGTRQAYIDLGPVTGFFNFASETTYSASGIASFENVGNGWYRFSLTTATAITPSTVYMGLGQSNSETYTGNGTSAIAFYGAQLNIGATAKPYFPTTDRLNVPRIDYTGGGCGSLLLEKQSTNLVTYSSEFDNAAWTKNELTLTANYATSPDGTQNADRAMETAASAYHDILGSFSATSGTIYTASCFVKSAGRDLIYIYITTGAAAAVKFNVSTGVVLGTALGTIVSSKITNYGNGWYRCEVSYTAGATTTGTIAVSTTNSTALSLSSYAGDITKGILIYGYQVEASSYATSYIPTTSTAVTRVADACYKTGISSLIGQTEGVIFIDVLASGQNIVGTTYGFFYIFGDAANNMQSYYISGTLYVYIVENGSVVINTSVSTTITANTRYKIALAYKSGQYAVYVNGAQVLVNTASAIPPMSQFNLSLSSGFGAASADTDNKFNQVILYTTRLTNDQLADLTGGNKTTFNALATFYGYQIL